MFPLPPLALSHVLGPQGDMSSSFPINKAIVGGHFNPFSVAHACWPAARSMGDIGQLVIASATGVQTISLSRDILTLNGGGPSETIIGRAVIIHANPDDCTTQPTGNAGTMIAQGVIGIAPPAAGATQMASANIAAGVPVNSLIAVLQATTAGAGITGQVQFFDTGAGIRVVASISGLLPSRTYPMHVHQVSENRRAVAALS
jgi:Cu/Zn superoxide dismutase